MNDVIIIGAGVAGLACAKVLQQQNRTCTVVETGAQVGGRIATDLIDGFQLDYGFQVLQTGYPDLGRYLNLDDLQLQKFPAGVIVRCNGQFHTLADPRYHPRHLWSTLTASVGSLSDRLALARLVRHVCSRPFADIFTQPEETTHAYLQGWGFSEKFIKSFFTPFFAGACLDKDINASNRVLFYLMRLFATGDATLPAKGMAEIPRQLAASLTSGTIQLNRTVEHVGDGEVTLADGTVLRGRRIVVATPKPVVEKLLQIPTEQEPRVIGETCLYYAAEWTPPFKEPFLLLNGDGQGPINNIALPSMVARRYAPPGKTLIAVVVVDDAYRKSAALEDAVRRQSREWFGPVVDDWQHLRSYQLDQILPDQTPPTHNPYRMSPPYSEKIAICGEYQSLPGLQWALMSGDQTGKQLAATLHQRS